MLTIFLFIILVQLIVWIFNKVEHREHNPITYGFAAFIGLMLGMLLSIIIGNKTSTQEKIINTRYIKSISDGHSISGKFFVCSGQINEISYYFFYTKLGNGGLKMDKLKTEKCIIYENNNNKSYGYITEIKHIIPEKSILNMFGLPDKSNTYKIYIPKNSIVQSFKLDLE